MSSVGRNAPCPCLSGIKFKKCCGSNSGPPRPVPQHVKDAVDQMMTEEGYTHEVALELQELDREKKQRLRGGLPAVFGAALAFAGVEEETAIKPCVGCGHCCSQGTCMSGMIEAQRHKVDPRPCPFLYERDGRYWCKLAERSPEIAKRLYIGEGCSSSLFNSKRDALLKARRSSV